MIKVNATEAQIVADAHEDGFSFVSCTETLNKYLLENDLDFVTTSQVQGVIKRLEPDASAIEKAKQGSSDPESPWAKARVQWIVQLLVRC